MNRLVIDASVAVEYLLQTKSGLKISDIINKSFLMAPELMEVEVLSVLRRAVLLNKLKHDRALMALDDLVDWEIERIPHKILVKEAWGHRENVSAYDAFYVAAAKFYNATLITADGPLSKAPNLGIDIMNIGILS